MSDKIRDIQDRMKRLGEGERLYAVIAYIPLFGWIYTYYFKDKDELCRFHARQALRLNLVLVVVYFLVWFLESFPILSWLFGPGKLLHHLSRSIWLIVSGLYLGVSALAAYKAMGEEKWSVPYLEEYLDKALELFKGK